MDGFKNLKESRILRTTSVLYDDVYWEEYWHKRFNVSYSKNDPSVIAENEKKLMWTQNLFHIPSGSLLDVGCSFGYFVSFLRDRGWNAQGIDCSDYALERAEADTKPFLHKGLSSSLPFGDKTFDVVTCFDVLEHLYIEEIMATVEEIKRVCKDAILIKLPAWGFIGEMEVINSSFGSLDKSHVSVYPWEFWARRFHGDDFYFLNASLWRGDDGRGVATEAWISFRRR